MPKILILYDEPYVQALLAEVLSKEGYRVVDVDDVELIWEYIKNTQPDLLLLDSQSDGFGRMQLYFEIKRIHPNLPVIVYYPKGDGAMDRIKRVVIDAVGKKMVPWTDPIALFREKSGEK